MTPMRQPEPFTYARQTGWWHVQWCKLARLLTPTFLRRPAMNAWLCMLVWPVQQLYNDWTDNRRENLYKVEHNSQVCYLRKALNDKFDHFQRRIMIDDGLGLNPLYIYTEGEMKPHWLYSEGENTPTYLHPASAYAGTGVDFYVLVPVGLVYNELQMRALIDFYRLAGKRYEIVEI